MKRLPAALILFAASFLAIHFLVLAVLPGRIMSAARDRLSTAGLPLHGWAMTPRVTPETQTIVRPAPDLAYAVCLIDVSTGPVELTVPSWQDYGSLSVFEDDTDNVYAGSLDARLSETGPVRRVLVVRRGQAIPAAYDGEIARVQGNEALALVRRLAPDAASHEVAAGLVRQSRCSPL